MHRTDKYSQHSLINHLASLANGLAFVYELSGCGFEFSWSHVNFRYHAFFDQGVSCHSGNYRCGFTPKRILDMITYNQMHRTDNYSQHSSTIWPDWLNAKRWNVKNILWRFESNSFEACEWVQNT